MLLGFGQLPASGSHLASDRHVAQAPALLAFLECFPSPVQASVRPVCVGSGFWGGGVPPSAQGADGPVVGAGVVPGGLDQQPDGRVGYRSSSPAPGRGITPEQCSVQASPR